MADTWQRSGVEFIVKDSTRRGAAAVNRTLATLDRQARDVTRVMGAIGAGIGLGVGALGLAGVSRGIRSAVDESVGFERQLAEVHTMLDRGSSQYLPQYRRSIEQMSVAFGEGTETLSRGMTDIIGSGIAPAKAIGVLDTAVRMAKGGFTTTAVAADALTTAINAWRLEAEDATRVADVFFRTYDRGKISIGELSQGIGNVASVAAQAGLSIEQVGAAIATMTRAGLKPEVAIMSLRTILQSFLKPTQAARVAARQFGLELNTATLRAIGLTGVLEKLKRATPEQIAAIIPESRGLAGFTAQLQGVEGALADVNAMMEAAGANQEALDKVTATTAHTISQLRQEWIQLQRHLGETAPVKGATGALRTFLHVLNTELAVFKEAKGLRLDVMYEGLSERDRQSAARGIESTLGKPFEVRGWRGLEEFDYTNMITGQEQGYARNVLEAYRRAPDVQARVQEQIAATRAAQEAAAAAAADAAGPMYGEMIGFLGVVGQVKDAIGENIEWVRSWGATYDEFAARIDKARTKLGDMTRDIESQAAIQELANEGVYRPRDVLAARETARLAYGEGTPEYEQALAGHQAALDRLQTAEQGAETAKAREGIERMNAALAAEVEIVGRLNDTHARSAELVEYELKVRSAYAGDATTQTRLLEEYRAGLDALTAARERADRARAQSQFDTDVRTRIADIRTETELLARNYEERQRLTVLRQYESEATRQGVEFGTAERAEMAAALRQYDEAAETARLVDGTMDDLAATLTDVALGFEDAADAAEAFLKTLARNMMQEYYVGPITDALGTVIKARMGGGATSLGGSATPGSYATVGSSGYTTSSGVSTVTGYHGGGVIGAEGAVAAVHHDGRTVGDASGTRRLPRAVVAEATRSLRPDERLIVAQVGEEVLTRQESRRRRRGVTAEDAKVAEAGTRSDPLRPSAPSAVESASPSPVEQSNTRAAEIVQGRAAASAGSRATDHESVSPVEQSRVRAAEIVQARAAIPSPPAALSQRRAFTTEATESTEGQTTGVRPAAAVDGVRALRLVDRIGGTDGVAAAFPLARVPASTSSAVDSASSSRRLPRAVVDEAARHLRFDERLIVAQVGEEILTRDESRRRRRRDVGAWERGSVAAGSASSAVQLPLFHEGGIVGGGAAAESVPATGGRPGPAPLKLIIKNESGPAVEAESEGPMIWDGESWMQGVILRAEQYGGPVREAIQRMARS